MDNLKTTKQKEKEYTDIIMKNTIKDNSIRMKGVAEASTNSEVVSHIKANG